MPPTAAPIGPKSDPSAAPAATPPAVPKFEVVLPDFVPNFWSSPFPLRMNGVAQHSGRHLDITLYGTVCSESAEINEAANLYFSESPSSSHYASRYWRTPHRVPARLAIVCERPLWIFHPLMFVTYSLL
jgi:hypothetical protein